MWIIVLDPGEECSSLLTWKLNEKVTEDGSNLHFNTDRFCKIATAQTLPLSLSTYTFLIEVMECSDEVWVGVGIDSSKDCLIYYNDGTIENKEEIVEEGETFKLNDQISCHCMRIRSNPPRVQATFLKNGKKVGQSCR